MILEENENEKNQQTENQKENPEFKISKRNIVIEKFDFMN